MATLTIVADENIPQVNEYFSSMGNVISVNGRSLCNEQILNADILLVRSVTQVNQKLLEGSRIRFVATATIGTDHLDIPYLAKSDIGWANAPGSNSNSVVDYVISALCRLDGVLPRLLSGAMVGIVGMGNVGACLYRRLDKFGVRCKGYDPLISSDCFPILTRLPEVLACDIVCCHTPLTIHGQYPTKHMIDYQRLMQLRDAAVLINAGRGAVVDNQSLKKVLNTRPDLKVVLDVWENEPRIDRELLSRVTLGSAHIAGYSFDGKLAGTEMIYRACCQFLGEEQRRPINDEDELKTIYVTPDQSIEESVRQAVFSSYDISDDDKKLRDIYSSNSADEHRAAKSFDYLRKHYPVRREFSRFRIGNTQDLGEELLHCLASLGFEVGTI